MFLKKTIFSLLEYNIYIIKKKHIMKHIKTFENFSINEEEGIRDFFGLENKAVIKEREDKFLAKLAEIEEEVTSGKLGTNIVFEKDDLIKQAKENSYRGNLEIVPSRSGNNVVVYKTEHTGIQKLASGSTGYKPF
jgi:hypothetical protein